MAGMTKKALQARNGKTFEIKLEALPEPLCARELSATSHAEWWAADEKTKNPIVRSITLVYLCLRDPKDPSKQLFDEFSEVGECFSFDEIAEIAAQYHKNVNPPKTVEEIKEDAKNSEATSEDASSSASVAQLDSGRTQTKRKRR